MNTNSVNFFNENPVKTFSDDIQLILAVWKIRNPENIGQVIRIAHNVGASKALFINEKKEFKKSKIEKTAGFSFQQMEWNFISEQEFMPLIQSEFKLIALETCSGAGNIFETRLPQKALILAGSESHGIPEEILKLCETKIFIPMPGGCKSMNVSHAISVAAFEWYRQFFV